MSRMTGLTLVEVLVAMLLMLIVTASALGFVARGRAAHRSGESIARLEEALDDAFALLVGEIQLAGYLGLAPPGTAVEGAMPLGAPEAPGLAVAGGCGDSLAHDPAPLAASDGEWTAGAAAPLGCRPSPGGRQLPGTDLLIVRHAAAEPSSPSAGRLQLETNLQSARLVADGGAQFGAGTRWHDLEVGVYYISADSTGRTGWPSLRRKRLVGGTRPAFQDEELVAGITDLQVEFGLDDAGDADDAVDQWKSPDEAPAVGRLRALRVTLEAQSDLVHAGQPERSRRKRVTRVIGMRNAVAGT
ncbi:MAG: PilW family protein [Gammaproteobacteria bacterium]